MSFFGMPIVSAVFAFFLVVFVHEMGHYWVGRLCGIGAKTFSIGLGPKIFSMVDKRNTELEETKVVPVEYGEPKCSTNG